MAAVKESAITSVVAVGVIGVKMPITITVIITAIIITEAFIDLSVVIEGTAVGFIIIIKDPH